uniref:leukocyte immunoglobulin-like receptor subfamily A member 4 n=1 Tax=Maylandia zebra TaxID=106582 RepID=UPI000D31E940|nr:leukocyte immunoglobulin-like receptor subfamily A member 4 [Maylandia zebra]
MGRQAITGRSSSPVWLMVGLVCGVSLIIILLLLLYRCRQSKYSCFTRSIQSESHSPGSSTNHGVNQDETHVYDSLQHGTADLYESVTQVKNRNGSDEYDDITSSLIEFKDLRTETPPKPTVTLQPSWPQIYSGETVTVRCEIQGGEGAQWTYEWSPAKLNTPPTSNEYTISSVSESDGGGYSCRATRGSSWTEWSDVITLNVKLPTKPTVTLQPSWTQIYCGETVTVRSPPKPTVTLQPPWPQIYSGVIYSGETVTVRCEIQGGEGAQWTYEWSPAKLNTPPTSSEYRISRATESDSGEYSCRGRRGSFWTVWSDVITLTVLYPPKPIVTLQSSYTQIYGGEIYKDTSVTVRCEIHGGERAQWMYEWRRGQKNIRGTSSVYTINRVTESDGGGYSCRGRRSSSWTEWSDSTSLKVIVPTKPTVTLQPSWTQIYSGETVTVRCEIQEVEGAQWTELATLGGGDVSGCQRESCSR